MSHKLKSFDLVNFVWSVFHFFAALLSSNMNNLQFMALWYSTIIGGKHIAIGELHVSNNPSPYTAAQKFPSGSFHMDQPMYT